MGIVGRVLLVLLAVGALDAEAYFLDAGRNFDVRVRAYSQLGIMTEGAETKGCRPVYATNPATGKRGRVLFAQDPRTCPPQYSVGDLAQHRNFYNPEFDAKLTSYTKWAHDVPALSLVAPDELRFRFAWWGFYDGLYDYLDGPWNDNRRALKTRLSFSDDIDGASQRFQDQNKNARHITGSRNRINELYVDYTKGPVFLRIGRQAISWGEADTIALLDVSNPFELVNGIPGIFTDVDEARIPLWTARGTFKLIDTWKSLSSVFLDTYLVPGIIDTTVPTTPFVAGISPFGPDQGDPQYNLIIGPTRRQVVSQDAQLQTVVADKLPDETWANSRWGVRLTGIVANDYTVQGWFFRTFNQAPVPVLQGFSAFDRYTEGQRYQIDDRGFRTPICRNRDANGVGRTPAGRPCASKAAVVTALEHRLESVVGLAATWFSQPVNGVIRTEAEFFLDELAFIPRQNLSPRAQIPKAVRLAIGDRGNYANTAATADYVRWLIGYDRFFFFRPINPSSSILLSAAFNSSFNLSEKGGQDYRNANTKFGHTNTRNGPVNGAPGCTGGVATRTSPLCVQINDHDYADAYQYEGFLNTTLQTDYLHGTLQPRLTIITDVSGIFGFAPSVTYRINDNLLLGFNYLAIESTGRKSGLATFRAHDMVQFRVTAQLN